MSNLKEIWFGNRVAAVGKIEPRVMTFGQFADNLRNGCERMEVDAETFGSMQKVERSQMKDGRYFCGTSFIAPSRRDTNCATVQVICIDIDDHESALVANPANLKKALHGYSWLLYSTVSSRPNALRYRLVVDASGDIPADFYPRCVATIGELIDLPTVSTESFTLSQPMYSPKVCSDVTLDFHCDTSGRPFTESDIDYNIEIKGKVTQSDAQDLGGLMFLEPPLDISTEEIEQALEHVAADCSLKDWVRLAGAIKHQFQGDDEEAFRVFHEWSKTGGESYTGPESCLKTWKTIKSNPDKTPATIRTVLHLASKNGWKRETSSDDEDFQVIREAIQQGNTHDVLLKSVPAMMQATPLPPEDFEALVAALKKQISAALGIPYPLAKLRKLCRYTAPSHIYETEDGKLVNEKAEAKQWAVDFCYIRAFGEYYNKVDYKAYKPATVDSVFGRYMMTPEELLQGIAKPATKPSDYLDNVAQIPCYEALCYHPGEPEVFNFMGDAVLNSYRDTAPKPSKDDATYREVKQVIDSHIATLLEDKGQADTLLDYLTHCVQQPGSKITWAVLLQGAYGNGKSFLHLLMEKALGEGNTVAIDAAALQEDFNDFAHGSQLVFIEEMRLSERREHAIMGRMKTMVANETLQIRLMYKPRYTVPNVTNYILLTNEKDAIQVNKDDRRYYIICTKQQTKEDVQRDMPAGYFDRLFAVLKHPGAIRRYFEERKISPTFEPKGRAPHTKSKEEFADHSLNDMDTALSDILEDLQQTEILSGTALFTELTLDIDCQWGDLRPTTSKLSKALSRKGYVKMNRYNIKGQKHTMWRHASACHEAVTEPRDWYLTGGLLGL